MEVKLFPEESTGITLLLRIIFIVVIFHVLAVAFGLYLLSRLVRVLERWHDRRPNGHS